VTLDKAMSFRELSHRIHKDLSKEVRQSQGIFFTPLEARLRVFQKLEEYGCLPETILEPSFGSGEFILDCIEKYPNAKVFGVEYNKNMYDSFVKTGVETTLVHQDFLTYTGEKVDLIIGNPPYFVVKHKNPECMVGRGNIFVMFLYKCLKEHLKENGILAFVLPTSFYNSSYYEPCRKFIEKDYTILHVETLKVDYYETKQDTMILMIQHKKSQDKPYILNYKGNTYINPHSTELKTLLNGTVSLKELGFQVKTGEVVWNQHKSKLSNQGTLLIYSSNIVNGLLVLNNLKSNEKKQYIKGYNGTPINGPAILVTRGYGNKFKFNFVLVDETMTFYGENHVNIILPMSQDAVESIPRVMASFQNDKMLKFIECFVGNGALSKTELEEVVPIF